MQVTIPIDRVKAGKGCGRERIRSDGGRCGGISWRAPLACVEATHCVRVLYRRRLRGNRCRRTARRGIHLRPRATGRIPLVLQIHGGPEDQDHRMYLAFRQYLAAHGVAVLVPHIHGSTGYGSSYQRAIHRDWGGIDLEDLEALARWALRQDCVDPERVAVYGASYGGFAALSAVPRLPRYWRVEA